MPDRRRANITCWGMEKGSGRIQMQEGISKEVVKIAISRLKLGKAAGIDGIKAEMLKYGSEEIVDIMQKVCQKAWEGAR